MNLPERSGSDSGVGWILGHLHKLFISGEVLRFSGITMASSERTWTVQSHREADQGGMGG